MTFLNIKAVMIIHTQKSSAVVVAAPCAGLVVKSEQSHPLGDGKKPFTGGQK